MNETTEEDVILLENWLVQSSENKEYFDQIQNNWNSIELEKELDDSIVNADFSTIKHKIEGDAAAIRYLRKNKWNSPGKWLLKAAAIFILGFAASWYIFNKPSILAPVETTYNVVETPRGSRATIKLPDGSKVLLNADSKLTYPREFKDQKLEVLLEGEAFFEVEKDAGKKFLVKTPEITVKVFGTSFNVKSYPDENTTETTLVEGSISIYKNSTNGGISGTELKMEPNQRFVLYSELEKSTPDVSRPKKIVNLPARKAKLVLSRHIDTDRFTSWKDGELKIEREPMKKLAVTLERRYDVKIHFESVELKQFRFSGTFKNETIEQVMAAIKLASPINYKMEDRDIWISTIDG